MLGILGPVKSFQMFFIDSDLFRMIFGSQKGSGVPSEGILLKHRFEDEGAPHWLFKKRHIFCEGLANLLFLKPKPICQTLDSIS